MVNVIVIEKDEKEFEEYLNDCYPSVTICGMEMQQGTILRECDPTTFRCALADEPIRYQCGECKEEFDTEEEAEECCKDVSEVIE